MGQPGGHAGPGPAVQLYSQLHCFPAPIDPADLGEIAEAFVMNRLEPVDAAIFGEHLLVCGRCIAAVEDADKYLRAMKVAAQRLRVGTARAATGYGSDRFGYLRWRSVKPGWVGPSLRTRNPYRGRRGAVANGCTLFQCVLTASGSSHLILQRVPPARP